MLSGVALIFADLVGTDLPGGSYRDRHGPPQLSIETNSIISTNDRYQPARRSAPPANGRNRVRRETGKEGWCESITMKE